MGCLGNGLHLSWSWGVNLPLAPSADPDFHTNTHTHDLKSSAVPLNAPLTQVKGQGDRQREEAREQIWRVALKFTLLSTPELHSMFFFFNSPSRLATSAGFSCNWPVLLQVELRLFCMQTVWIKLIITACTLNYTVDSHPYLIRVRWTHTATHRHRNAMALSSKDFHGLNVSNGWRRIWKGCLWLKYLWVETVNWRASGGNEALFAFWANLTASDYCYLAIKTIFFL